MHIDPIETSATPVATRTTRNSRNTKDLSKRRITLAAASVLSLGLLAGSIFLQDAATPVASESTAASSVSDIAGTADEHLQLTSFLTPNRERTNQYAETTIASANEVIAGVQDKVDATPLASSVASLGNYRSLDSVTIATLVKATQTETQKVQAAAAEVDRVAAEAAAAAAAAQAAEQAAQQAAQAAAEQAAANAAQAAANAAAAASAAKTPAGARAIARDMAASSYGWGESQFSCLSQLWERESGWSYTAYNASGGATGIPQALPGSKMASAGSDWATNPATQITWGLQYIKSSYGTPCAAWAHSESVNWY